MRGVKAKRLRAASAFMLAQRNLSSEPRYMEAPGSARERTIKTGRFTLQADGTSQEVLLRYRTVSYQLAPDCLRYYTQRMKPQWKGTRHAPLPRVLQQLRP